MEYYYPKYRFKYNKELNLFSAREVELYIDREGWNVPFPNKGRQFFIVEYKDNRNDLPIKSIKQLIAYINLPKTPSIIWHRRFRLKSQNENEYIFESEDGILCKIEKEVTKIY